MRSVVIGTAGHIDHGKSALVRALTGIDPDRLKEEQARGITIDLGFAHLSDEDLDVSFVDVPGHERFVRNMLAGAGGIDAVLLVVAATESVMPQTREHFDICRLLGIDRGVIAITKADLADAARVAQTSADVRALVAGSDLAAAPILPVSAKTGHGLDDLRRALRHVAGQSPRLHRDGIVRLPIDRVFSVKGHGTVITGTLVSGRVAVGDALAVLPEERPVRVRGLQVHGRAATEARAPRRVAVNLAGVDAGDLRRGVTLATPESLAAATRADVHIELLPGAGALKHGVRVRAHQGTRDALARVLMSSTRVRGGDWRPAAPGESGLEAPPGGEAFARLRFDEPMALTAGDRLVLRQASPPVTIGRATVLDPAPARIGVRTAAARRRFDRMAAGEIVGVLLEESAADGLDAALLVRRAGLSPDAAARTLRELEQRGEAVARGKRLVSAALAALERRDPDPTPPESQEALDLQAALEQRIRAAGLTPPEPAEFAEGPAEAPTVQAALQALVRDKRLVRVGTSLVHRDVLEQLRKEVAARRSGQPPQARVVLEVAEFKARYGLTRKHAIPLLEWLDRERVTRRLGDVRIVL